MKKEILAHSLTFILVFALIALFKNFLNVSSWTFWVGGIIGTILPDIDHLIYVYYLKPYELTSQRVISLNQRWQLLPALMLLANTRAERKSLIFHTGFFQIIFLVLAFLVITSSGGLLGRGIVLAFLLHFAVDQLMDFRQTGNLGNWTAKLGLNLDLTQTRAYLISSFVIVLLFGILL